MKKLSKDPRNVARRKTHAAASAIASGAKPRKYSKTICDTPAIPLFKLEAGESVTARIDDDGKLHITKRSVAMADDAKVSFSLGQTSDPIAALNEYMARKEKQLGEDMAQYAGKAPVMEAKPATEIEGVVNRLASMVDQAMMTHDRIEQRIGSVVSPPPPADKASEVARCYNSGFAYRLNGIAEMVEQLVSRQRSLEERIML